MERIDFKNMEQEEDYLKNLITQYNQANDFVNFLTKEKESSEALMEEN